MNKTELVEALGKPLSIMKRYDRDNKPLEIWIYPEAIRPIFADNVNLFHYITLKNNKVIDIDVEMRDALAPAQGRFGIGVDVSL